MEKRRKYWKDNYSGKTYEEKLSFWLHHFAFICRGGLIYPHISKNWIIEVQRVEPEIEKILYEILPELAFNPADEIEKIREAFKK